MFVLPAIDVPLSCINEAAVEFHVPAKLIISVLMLERGKQGQIVKNTNGSYDIGPAQINSLWLPELKAQGITQQMIQFDSCMNIKVAVWILSKKIAGSHELLEGIGDYHSHTARFNKKYIDQIKIKYTQIKVVLE